MQVEYIVYETAKSTYNPTEGLKLLGHPVAVYDNYTQMVDDWIADLLEGTHNFFVVEAS